MSDSEIRRQQIVETIKKRCMELASEARVKRYPITYQVSQKANSSIFDGTVGNTLGLS
jgi:hypothetical protein